MESQTLTPDEFSAAVTAITSAFGDETRREIYLYARDTGPGVTAVDVAEQFNLHANVARHHLEKLAAGGYLSVALQRAKSGAGRPSKLYEVRTQEMDLRFPVRRDDLIGTLLGRALELLPPETAEALAEEVGREYGAALAHSMEPVDASRSIDSAATAVATALTSHGFAAHTESTADGLRIVSEHCPFGDAALDHPFICAIDRGLVKGMLAGLHGEHDTDLSETRVSGATRCITNL